MYLVICFVSYLYVSTFRPFSVNPERCILEVEKIAMITVTFEADTVNDFFKHMVVRFEKGI